MDMIWTDYFVPALWSLGVIIAGMSLVAAGYRPFRKTSVKIVVFLLLVAYGTGVYVAYYYTEHGIRETNAPDALLAYVNNALSVFFPSRGAYE